MADMQYDASSNMTSSYPHQQDHIASLIFESSAQPGIGGKPW